MAERIRRSLYALLGVALAVLAAANWAKTALELRRFYTNMWIWDPWDYLSHFNGYRHFDLSVFWIQHNEHREIGTEILYVIDAFLFRGKQILPELAGIAAYVGCLGVFVACIWWSAKNRASVCAALLALGLAGYKLCVVSLTIPFLTSWPQWEFFGAASLAALVVHQRRSGKLFLLTAILLAVCATYSMSNGMLVWPLLLLDALVLRLSPKQIGAIAVSASLSIGLYFFHYANLHTIALGTAMHNPGYFVRFLGSFLGMPFNAGFLTPQFILMASVCGWCALALALANLVCIIRRDLFSAPVVIVLGGFCLLVIASAALTTLGRMNPADSMIIASRAGRYITEPTLFWCALFLLTSRLLGNAWKGNAALLFLTAAGLLTAFVLPKSNGYYDDWDRYFQRGQWAAIGLANGATDDSVGSVIFPSREYLLQFKHVLTDNRLAVFSGPEPGWVGRQANQTFSLGPDGLIHGDVTTVKKIGHDFEVQGWADGAARVIFVDETGRIIGFGMRPKAGSANLYTKDVPPSLAFTGFIRGDLGARQFSVWALDRKGRERSRMGPLQNQLSY